MLAMNKGQKIWRWDLEKRIRFQTMLQQGYTLTTIQSIWKENNIYSESPTISALSKEVRLGLTDEEAESKRYAVLFDGRQYVAVTDIKYDINSEGYNWKEEHFCDTIAKAVAYQHTDDKSVEDVMSIYSDLNFKGFFTALVKSEMEIRNNEIITLMI